MYFFPSNHFQLATKRSEGNGPHLYELDGHEALGSYLRIQPCTDGAPEVSECSIQWYRLTTEGGKRELISGIYAMLYLNYTLPT